MSSTPVAKPSPALLELGAVCKRYNVGLPNETEVLHGVSFNIARGELVGGSVQLAPGQWNLAEGDLLLPLKVQGLELEQLFILYPTEGLAGSGTLDGLFRAESLLDASVVCCAMTVEGLAGSHAPFDDRIQQASRLPGQIDAARRIRSLLDSDSEIRRSHENCERVQDPYAVRCMPQVFGAVEHTLRHARDVLGAAINGVSDNPLIFGFPIGTLWGARVRVSPLHVLLLLWLVCGWPLQAFPR